jgi:NTP pyrophosphatase (non-canonical NTP hydrolase)
MALQHFNGLTPAEAERLAMLAEEAGEVVQAACKVLRHGYASHHPADPSTDNRELLKREVADMRAVLHLMETHGDLAVTGADVLDAVARKSRYTHHQWEG